MSPAPVLKLENVSKIYDGATPFLALDNINFEIAKGEFVAITGPSGSGKSTMLHMLGCLDRPSKGEIYIAGRPISQMSDNQVADIRRDELGFVFQAFNLAPTLTVFQNVELPMMIKGLPKTERENEVRRNLAAVGLASKLNSMPSQLSGGEKQRVAVARALANRPKIILADEPTGNLDSKSSRLVMDQIEALCRDRGITIILITHEHHLAVDADRIIHLMDGRIKSDVRKKNTFRRLMK